MGQQRDSISLIIKEDENSSYYNQFIFNSYYQ